MSKLGERAYLLLLAIVALHKFVTWIVVTVSQRH